MIGHRIMGISLLWAGEIAEGRMHLDRGIALYDPAEHRPLVTRFGVDAGVSISSYRSFGSWLLGYPEAALAESEQALSSARESGQAATLMYALNYRQYIDTWCGNYPAANALNEELVTLADEKGAAFWKACGMVHRGVLYRLTGKASDALPVITAGTAAYRSMGSTAWLPWYLANMARTFAELGEYSEAWRCIDEALTAIETTGETWCEAEVNRIAGEIALMSGEPDATKAEGYFAQALTVARKQQAKSWELRVAMSMARLWRDQGKSQQARELLAPVYSWFTEGFDARDLKEAKALLTELA
jgi:predicted ATPase